MQTASDALKELNYDFSHDHTSYTFRARFFTKFTQAPLLGVLYDFEHLVKFVTKADRIVLIREGKNWYDVFYTYR